MDAEKPPYDGSHVEDHCPECGEFESECLCDEANDQDDGATYQSAADDFDLVNEARWR